MVSGGLMQGKYIYSEVKTTNLFLKYIYIYIYRKLDWIVWGICGF